MKNILLRIVLYYNSAIVSVTSLLFYLSAQKLFGEEADTVTIMSVLTYFSFVISVLMLLTIFLDKVNEKE